MKQKNLFKIALIFIFAISSNFSFGQLITTIDFETENSGYTTSTTEGDSFTDVFNRINDDLGGNNTFKFGVEDTNATPANIQLDQINVSGSASFVFSIDMIAHHYDDWDTGDELKIIYSIDGGTTYQNLMWVQNTGDTYNAPATLDTDFDGTGECGATTTLPALTSGTSDSCTVSSNNFATFTTGSIVLSSSETLDIRLEFVGLDSTDEGIYLDNIVITETAGSADPTVTFDATTSAVNETDTDVITTGIPITLSNYNTDVTVTATINGSSTAEAGDYTIDLTPLTFDANETLNIPLTIKDDADFDDETIIIDFTVTSGTANLGTSQHTVTITDDETAPTIGFDSATTSQTETDATFTVTIPLTVANYSGTQIDVSVASSGTAEGGDFTLNTASLSFTADGSQNISLDINDDADTDEETVILTITETSAVTGLVISQNTHTVTITDDEAPATYSGVGTFEKITDVSEIIDNGYYVLVDETNELFAMNNTHSGTILEKTDVTPVSNTLTNPDVSIVWEIKTDGSGKTIFNNATAKYVSYTGSSNNIQVVDAVIADNQRWTITYETDEFWISNLAVTNRRLQYNSGAPRFVCYTGSQRDISIYKLVTSTTVTWDGSASSVWATGANWDTNVAPIATDNVIIPDVATAPIIGATTGAVSNDLTITEPDGINITAGGSLIVSGTSSGNVTYNVNVADTAWHLITSPVVGEQYDGTWVTDNAIESGSISSTNRAIATYQNGTPDGATGPWTYFQTGGAATTFGAGVGYSLKRTGTGNYSFTGSYPDGTVTPSITQDVSHWNLIGNPYPSYINIDDFITANSANLEEEFQNIYVWNASTSSYTILTTGYIYPGQAFFISSNLASGNISITEGMQSHQTGVTFYKTENAPVIDLNLTSGESTKSTQINYLENKTTGLDPRFDIGMFDGVASDIRIYTQLISNNEGISFRRQALPNSDYENMVIPVGVKAAAGKEITFSTDAVNLPADIKVFLEDRFTNTFTRLDETNSEYKVTLSEPLNGVGRFYMHTTESVLSTKDVILNSVHIYKTDASTLKITGLPQGKTSFYLYNILGKEIVTTLFTSNGNKEISLSKLASGIYLAKMQTEKGVISKKIILE